MHISGLSCYMREHGKAVGYHPAVRLNPAISNLLAIDPIIMWCMYVIFMMVIYGLTSEYTLLSAMFIINNNILNINIDINISIGISILILIHTYILHTCCCCCCLLLFGTLAWECRCKMEWHHSPSGIVLDAEKVKYSVYFCHLASGMASDL